MKTKRLFFIILMIIFSFSAFALDRVVDNAGLLSPAEIAALEKQIASVAQAYNFDLVIVTEKIEGASNPGEYANNFFDNRGYGFGANRDGCIFLQITESRDYEFSASGRGIRILNDTAFNKLASDAYKFLREGNPFEAYRAFIFAWEEFLALDAKGRSYNFFHQWNFALVAASWIIALLTGFIVTAVWKSKMNTVTPQLRADAYIVPNSLAFKINSDRFLYSTVSKVKRETQSSGGGSTHRSSRGGGGKY